MLILPAGFRAAAQADLAAPAAAFAGVDAELMVQFNDLGSQLGTPAGLSLRRMMAEMGMFERTREAWASLSGALKMDPDTSIDRLLGGRVLLIADDVGEPAMRWACVMSVDPEVARLVPKRLRAVPRDSMDGRTVYAVEDGRFRVVQLPARGKNGVAAIAIAHAGADGLLRAGSELGSHWRSDAGRSSVVGAGAGPGAGVALLLYRSGPGSWLWGELEPAVGGWRLEFSASQGLFGPIAFNGPAISEEWFHSMSADSVLAFAGPVGRSDSTVNSSSAWYDLGPDGLLWKLLPFDPPEALINSGASLASVSVGASGRGRLDCSLSFLVPDAERAARVGDEYVCDILEAFTGSPGYGENAPLCTGTYPGAARWQTVELEEGNTRRPVYGSNLAFVWGVRPDTDRRGEGWWTMRALSENMPDAAAVLLRHHTPIDIRGDSGFAVAARVRPAQMLSMMPLSAGVVGQGVGGDGPISLLRWIDEVIWRVDAPARVVGVVSGDLTVRMRNDH